MKLRLYYPVKPYSITQAFGQCDPQVCKYYKEVLGLNGHNGDDVVASTGTPIRAAHDGTVVFAGEDGSAGYGVVVRTDEMYDYKGASMYFKSIYWHLLKTGIQVRAGQKVKTGDVIGLADSTGISLGSHLHFGLKPVYQGEASWQWLNTEQDNGFKGAVDSTPYWVGMFAEDVPREISRLRDLVAQLTQKLADLLAKK